MSSDSTEPTAQVDALVTCLSIRPHNPGYGNDPTGGPGRPPKVHYDFRFRDAIELRDYLLIIVNDRLAEARSSLEQLSTALDDAELLHDYRTGKIATPTDAQLISIGRALAALSR